MDSFIFKGKSSLDFENLVVCNIPPITKPPKRTEIIEIDGKDGNIINELGYQSYEKEVTLFRKGDIDVDKLADWLNGTGQLIFSNEEDKYYNATIINQIDFPRFINYEYIKVVFKIQPFKYSNLDENIVFNCKSVLDRCTTASINAAVGKLKNVKVYGKLEQETSTTGKNKFGYLDEEWNSKTYKYIKLPKTATNYTLAVKLKEGKTVPAGLYFGFTTYGYYDANQATRWLLHNGYFVDSAVQKDGFYYINNIATYNYISFYDGSTTKVSTLLNEYFDIQLQEGTEFDSYEQFIPNIPSPSYEGKISVTGDNINHFDISKVVNSSPKHIDLEIENNTITLTAIGTVGAQYVSFSTEALDPTETYRISCKTKKIAALDSTTKQLRISYYYSDDGETYTWVDSINTIINSIENKEYTINGNVKGHKYYKFLFYNYVSTPVPIGEKSQYYDIKIEKGTTQTNCTPYNCGGIDYKYIGKNVLPSANITRTINGVTFTKNEDGSITVNGTATARVKYPININSENNKVTVKLLDNTRYYMSSGVEGTSTTYFMQGYYTKGGTSDELYTSINSAIFTPATNITVGVYIVVASGATVNNVTFYPQLETDGFTEYEPHKENNATIVLPENEFMGKIGNYQDYIEGNILHKKTGKVVLGETADINWNQYTKYDFDGYIAFETWNIPVKDNGTEINIACNYFQPIASGYTIESENISKWGTGIYIRILASRLSTQDSAGFNQYIKEMYEAGTPIEIYYVLAEEYTVELDEFELPLLEGINNISSDAEIEAEYYNPKKLSVNNVGLQKSLPIIKLKGEGISSLYVNSIEQFIYKFPTEEDNSVIIDSIEQEAYYDGILKNRNMNGEFPELIPGTNEITWTGDIDKFEINPKSRWL